MVDFDWNGTNVKRLKELYADGLPASRISTELGRSRNAVIGKIHRLGLARRNRIAAIRAPKPPRVKRQQSGGNTNRLEALMLHVNNPAFELEPELILNPVAFADLEPHHCRWPIGDGPIFFCGADRFEDRPYCTRHCGKAYDFDRTRRSGEHDKQEIDKMRLAIQGRAA